MCGAKSPLAMAAHVFFGAGIFVCRTFFPGVLDTPCMVLVFLPNLSGQNSDSGKEKGQAKFS